MDNKKLNELAIQADIWCDQNCTDRSIYNLAWEKKFAELIIADCVSITNKVKEEYSKIRKEADDFSYKNVLATGEVACETVEKNIKEYFGV